MSVPLDDSTTKTRANANLSARVYSQIKQLILCNEIMPGQKLHHQQFSERLGVSRTPVREALKRLVQEGYVAFLPNRGFTCKEIRNLEAQDLYDLSWGLVEYQKNLRLLAATERRDTAAALNLVRSHIQAHKRNVMADLKQRQAIRDTRPGELTS